jgi:hypothetical protein
MLQGNACLVSPQLKIRSSSGENYAKSISETAFNIVFQLRKFDIEGLVENAAGLVLYASQLVSFVNFVLIYEGVHLILWFCFIV